MVFDDGDEFVLGVVIGALIGAGVALLLAPDSGKRTRRRIRRSAEDLSDAAGDTLQTVADDAKRLAEDARKAGLPADAVQVFVFEATPRSTHVTDRHIAVDYGRSGVLFDRAAGKMARRFTVADGWPEQRHEAFGPTRRARRRRRVRHTTQGFRTRNTP